MLFLYPVGYDARIEQDFSEEYYAVVGKGFDTALLTESGKINGNLHGQIVVYRGWMLDRDGYQSLWNEIVRNGGLPYTLVGEYVFNHHLPMWYTLLQARNESWRTMESVWTVGYHEHQLVSLIEELDWCSYFVKDYVKSNTMSLGSIGRYPSDVVAIVDQLRSHRGVVEGGVVLRRVVEVGQETRYFQAGKEVFSPTGSVSEFVLETASLLGPGFRSLDVSSSNVLVEIGDGQVSGYLEKGWTTSQFMEVLASL